MGNKLFKMTSLLFICFLMLSSAAFAASSETVKSGETTVKLNGIEYVFYSEAYTYNDTGIYAKTTLKTANGEYVAANTMRAKTSLYNSSGQLIKQSALAENSVRVTGLSPLINYGARGTYYAVGEVQIYSGTTWKTYTTLKTGTIKY